MVLVATAEINKKVSVYHIWLPGIEDSFAVISTLSTQAKMTRLFYSVLTAVLSGFIITWISPLSLAAQQAPKNSDSLQMEDLIVVPLFLLALATFMMIIKRRERAKQIRKASQRIHGKRHHTR